ncbi:MAG: aspartate kinase [Flavobacteriaceae bacterium]|nr:aspartate kinase [Flavobacteriaceae bacterium]
MRVYKFGGASVKDAKGIKNLLKVLNEIPNKNIIVIISAMGKMTNAFEKIVTAYFNNEIKTNDKIDFVKKYHSKILDDLFFDKNHLIYDTINLLFIQLSNFLINNNKKKYNFVYDQVVSIAELISTKIVSAFLNDNKLKNNWLDVRHLIKTNSDYREALVDWDLTEKNIKAITTNTITITQGFLGSDINQNTTTLGREGSDYTAAIFAYCLAAESVSIFKDVAGVLNADPRVFKETILLTQISYTETIEMAFYGASVIHPKTIQPLQKKEIKLFVKSFKKPLNKGTMICKGVNLKPKTACYIVKNNQVLVSIASKNFSFIMEKNISEIFNLLHRYKLKVCLIQNTAISFLVCLEDKFNTITSFLDELKLNYKSLYTQNVSLVTIRHFTKKAIQEIEKTKEVLVKQTSKEVVQFVVKN